MSRVHNLFNNTSDNTSPSNFTNSLNTIASFNNCASSFNSYVSNHFTAREDRSEVLAWLSPLEPHVRHQNLEASRVDRVGSWLLRTEKFRSWCGGNNQAGSQNATMFCCGNPGAGKTYISSLVVDTLCDHARGQNIAVACFYFDFAAGKEQTPANMLGALLKQVVGGLDKIPGEIMQEYEAQRKVIGGRNLTLEKVANMLVTVTSLQHTFICVDAVDECAANDRANILKSLGKIIQRSPTTRVFLTGRPHVWSDVESRLPGGTVVVPISPWKDDIVHFIRTKLEEDATPDEMDSRLEAEIVKKIPETVSEIFLLVALNLEAILQEPTIYRRRKRLCVMNNGLSLVDAYGETLERIKVQGAERSRLGLTALMWICHSERPLEVDELCHALAIEIGSVGYDPDNAPSIRTVLNCCQGLVVVDKQGSAVRLIHFTLQEYISTHPDLFRGAHSVIAETCLIYLNSQHVTNLPTALPFDIQATPFLRYSALYWGIHGKKELSDRAKSLALKFLGQYHNHISSRLILVSRYPYYLGGIKDFPPYTGLHCASFFGLVGIVEALIEMGGFDINQGDFMGITSLGWAAWRGHEGVVQLLLERGDVSPDSQDRFGRTPLSFAAKNGHEGVVQILLRRSDVNPNSLDNLGQTALSHAAENGYSGVVKLLLRRGGVNPDSQDSFKRTPLSFAAKNGHERVVQLLLARQDVRRDLPDERGQTPLSWAAEHGREGIVRLLLGRGDVDPDKPDYCNRTPLSYAAENGYEGMVQLLLGQRNVNPDTPDNGNRTPLSYAAENGHGGVAQLLMWRGGVAPDLADERGQTPLSWAAENGHEGIVRLLLGRGDVDPDKPDHCNRTPLSYAAENGYEGVVQLLLEWRDVHLDG